MASEGDERAKQRVQRYMARDRQGGNIVELGYQQQRFVTYACAAIGFAVLAVAHGHEMSVFSWLSLAFSLLWYTQASSFAVRRATLLNMGAHGWRTQNVFIYWWCNKYLPCIVFAATALWTLRW